MPNIVRIRRTSTPDHKPATNDLEMAELAVNIPDGRLYTADTSGHVVDLTGVKEGDYANVDNLKSSRSSFTQEGGQSRWWRIMSNNSSRHELSGILHIYAYSGTGGKSGAIIASVSFGNTNGTKASKRFSILSGTNSS